MFASCFSSKKILVIGPPAELREWYWRSDTIDMYSFDMSQLVIYYRALTDTEIQGLPGIGLGEDPLECCMKRKRRCT